MNRRVEELMSQIGDLEKELKSEIERIRIKTYEIHEKTVEFTEDIRAYHKTQITRLGTYLRKAKLKHIVTAPVIWCCIFPALFMDLVVTVYQAICFPVYGIPKVRRRDHIVIDRHYLGYLNVIEKINCVFCGYFNGLIAYVHEVAARTEQYWCPIKHARQIRNAHSRYHHFTEFGDSDRYRSEKQVIRKNFSDIEESGKTSKNK